jgi:hypothetical protein
VASPRATHSSGDLIRPLSNSSGSPGKTGEPPERAAHLITVLADVATVPSGKRKNKDSRRTRRTPSQSLGGGLAPIVATALLAVTPVVLGSWGVSERGLSHFADFGFLDNQASPCGRNSMRRLKLQTFDPVFSGPAARQAQPPFGDHAAQHFAGAAVD